jgi:hypothetical protein
MNPVVNHRSQDGRSDHHARNPSAARPIPEGRLDSILRLAGTAARTANPARAIPAKGTGRRRPAKPGMSTYSVVTKIQVKM